MLTAKITVRREHLFATAFDISWAQTLIILVLYPR